MGVAYLLYRTVRDPPSLAPAYLRGIRIRAFLFVLASFEGWLMVAQGGHGVGVPNDAPGLPLLNWSVTGGDLRVAHFVGLHALQVLPLTGYVAARRVPGRRALAAVAVVAVLYGGVTVVTFVLALLGLPIVPTPALPAVPTGPLAAAFLLGAVATAGTLATVWRRNATPG